MARSRLILALVLVLAADLLPTAAQPPSPWVKLAPFPEPAEELYGVAAGGKLYVRHRVPVDRQVRRRPT